MGWRWRTAVGGQEWRRKQRRAGTAVKSGTETGRRSADQHPVQFLLQQEDRKRERLMLHRHAVYWYRLQGFTRGSRLSLVSVQDESVPGGAEHSAQLGHCKSIGILAHWDARGGKQNTSESLNHFDEENEKKKKMEKKVWESHPGWGRFWPAGWAWSWACRWRDSVSAAVWTATTDARGRTRTKHSSGSSPLNKSEQ